MQIPVYLPAMFYPILCKRFQQTRLQRRYILRLIQSKHAPIAMLTTRKNQNLVEFLRLLKRTAPTSDINICDKNIFD